MTCSWWYHLMITSRTGGLQKFFTWRITASGKLRDVNTDKASSWPSSLTINETKKDQAQSIDIISLERILNEFIRMKVWRVVLLVNVHRIGVDLTVDWTRLRLVFLDPILDITPPPPPLQHKPLRHAAFIIIQLRLLFSGQTLQSLGIGFRMILNCPSPFLRNILSFK